MSSFTMPSLGADMEEGTLLEWLVKPGDTVHKGDIVAVVDTSKAAVEVETFVEGVVTELLVPPGTKVAVGAPLATIDPLGSAVVPQESPQAVTAPPVAPQPAPPPPTSPPPPTPPPTGVDGTGPRVTSPLVRQLAEELGVPLGQVRGTGRGGAVTRADVTRAADARTPPRTRRRPEVRQPGARQPVTPYARKLAQDLGVDLAAVQPPGDGPIRAADVRAASGTTLAAPPGPAAPAAARSRGEEMRATIAARMSRAKREIPHYYLSTTLDLDRPLAWMHRRNLDLPVAERLVPAALLLKATALAAADVPELNGFWTDGTFRPGTGVHLGLAISLRGGGLVAPAILDAAELPLPELMSAMRDLVTRARAGRLRAREMSEPTITVTNLGEQGVESVYGVIYPPQVALVGFGRVVERPWAVDGLIGVRPLTTLTLAADHRATDGFTGGRLLTAIQRHLEQPEEL